MNSRSLEAWQIERLFKRIQQELHFLDASKVECTRSIFPQTTWFSTA